jgi:uncharacterized protein YqeY
MSLKQTITDEMKSAMRAGDKPRLGIIRLIQAAIKQIEVDERIELDDARIISVLDKMLKQRRESASQYQQAGRDDLADQENYEIGVLQEYLPTALSEVEIAEMIEAAIADSGATSMKEMGKVIGMLKPRMQGRADMAAVSATVKQKLSG